MIIIILLIIIIITKSMKISRRNCTMLPSYILEHMQKHI